MCFLISACWKKLMFCLFSPRSVHSFVPSVLLVPKFVPFVPNSLSLTKHMQKRQWQKGQCNPLQYWIFSEKLIRNRRTKLLFELKAWNCMKIVFDPTLIACLLPEDWWKSEWLFERTYKLVTRTQSSSGLFWAYLKTHKNYDTDSVLKISSIVHR